jgi:hypothetical protein
MVGYGNKKKLALLQAGKVTEEENYFTTNTAVRLAALLT